MAGNRTDNEIITETVKSEVQKDSKRLAERLFPSTPPGMTHLSEPEFIARVAAKWPDQGFRLMLRKQYGAEKFMAIGRAVLGLNKRDTDTLQQPLVATAAFVSGRMTSE